MPGRPRSAARPFPILRAAGIRRRRSRLRRSIAAWAPSAPTAARSRCWRSRRPAGQRLRRRLRDRTSGRTPSLAAHSGLSRAPRPRARAHGEQRRARGSARACAGVLLRRTPTRPDAGYQLRRSPSRAGAPRDRPCDAIGQNPKQRQQATRRVGHARALDRQLERGREVEQAVFTGAAPQHFRPLGLPALPDAREVRLCLSGIGEEFDRERHAVERGQQLVELSVGRMSVAGDCEENTLRVLATERLNLDCLAPGGPAGRFCCAPLRQATVRVPRQARRAGLRSQGSRPPTASPDCRARGPPAGRRGAR